MFDDFYGYMGMRRVEVPAGSIPFQEPPPTGSTIRIAKIAAAAALALPAVHGNVKEVGVNVPAAEVGIRVAIPSNSSITDKVSFIKSEIGLNMTQLADVLHVRRPTVYAWIGGRETLQSQHEIRVQQIYELAVRWSRLAPNRGLRRNRIGENLLQLLSAETLNKAAVISAMRDSAATDGEPELASSRIYRASLDQKQLSEQAKRRRLAQNLSI